MAGMEWHLVEAPTLSCLKGMGYDVVPASKHSTLRDGENRVLFRPDLVAALKRINGISQVDAEAVYADLVAVSTNEHWLSILHGNFSRKVEGKVTHQTLRVIDFHNVANNIFTVTNQF